MARLAGDLSLAEDCAQEACAAAVAQWAREGLPANPGGWVVAVARRRALDHLRRESARAGKERHAAQEWAAAEPDGGAVADDQLALLFACCHPALDPAARVALTLRVVCGLPAASIAQLLLQSEPAVAQRIVRAKRKIRDAGIRLRVPDPGERPARLASVLRVIYLTFTEGHAPHGTSAVVRDDLCEEALRLAARLHRLLPDEPEVTGLLALILLTSARTAARADQDGALVLLTDQDRSRWDRGRLAEGRSLLEAALAQRRPGPYQLQAAIAACHTDAATAAGTDWRQIAALYGELLRFDPSPVIEANRAVAVAYAEGPAAGLAILDTLAASSRLARWPQLHIARAALLARCGRSEDAVAAYRDALALEPADPVRRHVTGQIAALSAAHTSPGDLMDVGAAVQSQIRNIEVTYGKPLDHWFAVIDASGLTKHNQVVAMLKADHGLAHGVAHRVSLLFRQRHDVDVTQAPDPADALYAGAKASLRPLHDALLGQIRVLGPFDIAPKKGYLSLRRRKQFAMVQPSTASRIDLGLILPATTPAGGRLEPAAKFNPLFTHRVRITAATDLDDELRGWLAAAYALGG